MNNRIDKAVELFKSGYNCSQAVFCAFADISGFTDEQALRISASFGGGIGRMRQTCGAACGIFMLAGLETASLDPKDQQKKAANYELVQQLAKIFVERNGSLNCGELLGSSVKKDISPIPEERNTQYYTKRPCVKIIEESARIWHEHYKSITNK